MYDNIHLMFKSFLNGLKIQHLSMRGSSLYLLQAPLWLALPASLFRGQFFKTAALAFVIASLSYGANLTRRYYLHVRDQLLLGKEVTNFKDERKIAMGYICLGVFVLSSLVTRRIMPMGFIATALAALGYYLNYLAEPSSHPKNNDTQSITDINAEQPESNSLPPTLAQMITDGHRCLARISQATTQLNSTDQDEYIVSRLKQITRRGNALLTELSKDANRVREARTLLVIHLPELSDITHTYAKANNVEKAQSRQQFSALLDTIHTQLTEHYRDINDIEQQNLSIQMDVLQEQLEQPKQHAR